MSFSSRTILDSPIEYLKGVGPQRGELLRKELNLHTFRDVLSFFPFRYVDRSSLITIQQINTENAWVQFMAQPIFTEVVGEGRTKRLVSTVRDTTGRLELVWFKGISAMEKLMQEGGYFLIYGKATRFNQTWSISHPEIERLEQQTGQFPPFHPVYSSSEKLKNRGITNRVFSKMVQSLMAQLKPDDVPEILPAQVVNAYRLLPRFEAFKQLHFPTNLDLLEAARYRMKFEELLILQIGICKLKLKHQAQVGFLFQKVGDYFNGFYKHHLPFELTDDQKQVLREIRQNTQIGFQMNRLLQGDVGSGKTIVALLCMLLALDNGFQACLMAPTEILAQQHFAGISELVKNMPLQVAYLSGTVKGKQRKELLARLLQGDIHILIGTHALIEDTVQFKNLGLCIIDEQHRFGVAQRAKLWQKNSLPPHMLVMTATPIPRTLAMTVYGDLDVSVIKNLPPGRKPISTVHRSEMHRAKIMDFIKFEIEQGRQAYIVYPLIQESEKLDYENLMAGYEQVKQFFPEHRYRIAMVHGKMPIDLREANMQAFIRGEAHILVATTVIEVGVNVPNASVMLIESAERFGLSQLHQLRGRVGRGADKSYCILLTSNKLSDNGRIRMQTMVEESSGFAISEKDMELRGPGEIDGTRQSGVAELKMADLVKDAPIMEQARAVAQQLLQEDPFLENANNDVLKRFLMLRSDREIWRRIS
ncbi:MAG: ATP-dependent DNA helicase RecG [Chitinophagaceae bacterium]